MYSERGVDDDEDRWLLLAGCVCGCGVCVCVSGLGSTKLSWSLCEASGQPPVWSLPTESGL